MNKTSPLAVVALLALAAYAAPSQAEIDVSINIGQPGFYGTIDLAGAPRPRIIYAQPVIVERVTVVQQPIYLHVRPGQARNWKNHCAEYGACGRQVYFVNDNWYNTVYVQHHRDKNGKGNNGHGHGGDDHGKGHDNGKHKHKGNGKGNGHGKGNGKGKH